MPDKLLRRYKLMLFCIAISIGNALAQNKNRIILNVDVGLPSNNVYSVITDKNNYLWIATDNGVARYNGYEFKTFSTEQGLPTNDIWQLLEDTDGRIWLGCIADKLGYIQNERYESAAFNGSTSRTIYPRGMRAIGSDLLFSSAYLENSPNSVPYVAHKNNIKKYNVYELLKRSIPNLDSIAALTITYTSFDNNGIGYYLIGEYIARFTIDKNKDNVNLISVIRIQDPELRSILSWTSVEAINGYLVFVAKDFSKEQFFYAVNGTTGASTKINVGALGIKENIVALHYNPNHNDNTVCAVTEKHLIVYDVKETISVREIAELDKMTANRDIKGSDILYATNDPYWGHIICTKNKGLFIYPDTNRFFTNSQIPLSNFTKATTTADGRSLWFDKLNYKLLILNSNLSYKVENCRPNTLQKKTITRNSLLFSDVGLFYDLDHNISFHSRENGHKRIFPVNGEPNSFIYISNIQLGKVNSINNVSLSYDADRYIGLINDSVRGLFWAHTKNKIVVLNDNKLTTLTSPTAKQLCSHVVEKMDVDQRTGTIFIKTDGKLYFYDYEKDSATDLLPNLSLKEAYFYVHDHRLIVYGRFGLALYAITGKGKISEIATFRNIKNSFFNIITDAFEGTDSIIVNTDRGVFSLPDPKRNSTLPKTRVVPQIFLYYYNNNVAQIKQNDTIYISKDVPNIRFDIINPAANGRAKYSLAINGTLNELNANEFAFPANWTPDNYYEITLLANDRIWRSTPVKIVVYVQPKWYQTKTMVRVKWASIIIATVLIIIVSAFVTQRMVVRANQKRNAQMELELKSIYAQINPHFIFNSLNSALLLVSKNRMDDAYNHISKFSRLLRSYIKSSRNKYILLSEEIKNLTNYIDLQQTRFKERFTYTISIDESIDVSTIWIPSLLLQPFVENAIEHGLLPLTTNGELNIRFNKGPADRSIICTIEDNGIGRKESKLSKIPNPGKDESYGELLIKDLVSIFNKYEHMRIHVSYQDKTPPLSGTIVTINIEGNEFP